MLTASKIRTEKYDFDTYKASEGRAGIHDYPAMLHYLLVEDLLNSFAKKDSIVYDPFCGSGVSIVQALKAHKKVIGTDINPLALLVAHTRTLNVNPEAVELTLAKLQKAFYLVPAEIPPITNIDYWFKPNVIEHLGKLRALLIRYDDLPFSNLLKTAFSQTVRAVSNNKKGEFKRYRMPMDKLANYHPNVWETFKSITLKYSKILSEPLYFRSFELFKHDLKKPLRFNDKVDLVITSPPYGDSKTTVAYGQFSSFSLQWLRGLNPYGDEDLHLDSKMLGGGNVKHCQLPPSKTLALTLDKIQDKKRADEVKNFFFDLFLSCTHIVQKLSNNPTVCFVVGNRTVNSITIAMDDIIREFFEFLSLTHYKTFIRKINNKRMPSLNSPTNLKGKKSSTILEEYIVVMKG